MTRLTLLVSIFAVAVASEANAAVVAQYSFEEGARDLDSASGGTVADDFVSGAGPSGGYTTGVVGDAAVFGGGANDWRAAFDSSDLDIGTAGSWTIEAFVSDVNVSKEWNRTVLKWTSSHDYHFAIRNGNLDLFDSSITEVLQANTALATDFSDGEWHHIAITSDGSGNTAEAWIDGVSVWNGSAITLAAGTDNLVVGGGFPDNSSFNFVGKLDEVRIHNSGVDQSYIDGRVALISTVPEPTSIYLTIVGFLVVASCIRRGRK